MASRVPCAASGLTRLCHANSRLMNYFAFDGDAEGKKRFEQTIASLLHFAIDKLNGKGECAVTGRLVAEF